MLPVRCPTMPCFGGADLKTLYITTAREKRPADELAQQPLAGCVLSLRVDVPGLPVNFAAEELERTTGPKTPRRRSGAASLAAPSRQPPRLADRQHAENASSAHALRGALFGELARRLVERFVGQLEGAPVHADRALRAEVEVDAHRLGRIDVLLLHEPARLVGADRNQRDVEAAAGRGGLARREALSWMSAKSFE